MAENRLRYPRLIEFYAHYLLDKSIDGFAAAVARVYTQGTLQRLTNHPLAEVRRAAAHALGLVGDYVWYLALGRGVIEVYRWVRSLADEAIRRVWNRVGTNDQRRQLAALIRLNAAQHYRAAAQLASELAGLCAELPEIWHQWGVACYHLEQYDAAVRNCHQALELNPYHFPAASLMGQAYMKLANHPSALESFRRALGLNPDLEGVRVYVARLVRMVEGK